MKPKAITAKNLNHFAFLFWKHAKEAPYNYNKVVVRYGRNFFFEAENGCISLYFDSRIKENRSRILSYHSFSCCLEKNTSIIFEKSISRLFGKKIINVFLSITKKQKIKVSIDRNFEIDFLGCSSKIKLSSFLKRKGVLKKIDLTDYDTNSNDTLTYSTLPTSIFTENVKTREDHDCYFRATDLDQLEIVDVGDMAFINDSEVLEANSVLYSDFDEEYFFEASLAWGIIDNNGNQGYFSTHDNDYVSVHGGSYVNEEVARHFSIVNCSSCGDFYNCEETSCCEEEEEEESNDYHTLRPYHTAKFKDKTTLKTRFKCGFEIEKETESVEVHYRDFEEKGWTAESDSSLDDNGFELVSPVFDMQKEEEIKKDLFHFEKFINAEYSNNCGGHIHVSDVKRTPKEILRDLKGYECLLLAMYPYRTERSYCKPKKFSDYSTRPEKYSALYVKERTLEIRIFPSPKNVETLIFRKDLLLNFLQNPCKTLKGCVKKMQNPKTKLFKLLSQRYNEYELKDKIKLMFDQHNRKEDRKLVPSL